MNDKNDTSDTTTMTGALEDYLETIYELVRDQKLARVKDIARIRGVQAGSVSPAMRRLADMGLIRYAHREYIDLTPEGEEAGRRILARHQLLTRFFVEILKMPRHIAEADACAMEHNLSNEGMDHLTRFFEFLHVCPEGQQFLESFHACPKVHDEQGTCSLHGDREKQPGRPDDGVSVKSVAELQPGERATVTQVSGAGAIRRRLLDMGILPDTLVEVERVAPTGDPIWIRLQGFQLSLRRREARLVSVKAC